MSLLRRFFITGAALVSLVACSSQPPPQPTEPGAEAVAHGGHAPDAAPAAPRTKLLGNLGSYTRTIATTNAEAQQFFN